MSPKTRKVRKERLEKQDKADAKRRKNEPQAKTDPDATVSGIESKKEKKGVMAKVFGASDNE